MAHIQKRGPNRWRARYRAPDGQERSKTFDRKADAERFLAQAKVDQLRGLWVDPRMSQVTLATWIMSWSKTLDVRRTTRDRDLGIVRNYLVPRLGGYPLGRITPVVVRAFIAELQAEQQIASASVRKVGQVLARVMSAAVDAGLIARSPCERLRLPTEAKRDLRFLDAREVRVVAESAGDYYCTLIYTAAYTGLRWGELAGLRPAQVNPLQRTLSVVEQLTEVAGLLEWGPPKTSAGTRTVALPRFLAAMLEEQLALAPVVRSGLAFPNRSGEPLRRSPFRRHVWTPTLRRAGIEGMRFHDLRHTAVALAIAQGAHPKAIQERMGHSSITVTLDRYGHLFPVLDELIADGLDATFAAVAP
jgi:integrase